MAEASNSPALGASRSVYYSLTDDVPDLTEEEKKKLEIVMQKALEFEAEEAQKIRQILEGQLYKYTNVMKGWQYRWFVVTPDTGTLEYYMLDERRKSKPRGALNLSGAVVTPSEDDSQSFAVTATCGELYKLKANDARERQVWVDKLRTVIDASTSPDVFKGDPSGVPNSFALCQTTEEHQTSPEKTKEAPLGAGKPVVTRKDSILEINESVTHAVQCQKVLTKSIEDLPYTGPHLKCSDNRLLLLKAISSATVQSLEQCYLILRRHRQREGVKSTALSIAPSIDSLDKFRSPTKKDKKENTKNI
ncbi:hypothetical protein JTE90_008603 [Oedothorax gibbosus]|uniref:PH domain-containing protein n=1 Tax=Oedothorax gibbosus TaxID=931172 RepID=A0AAV6UC00_9ARAC|nr:hypothetical protein JTE90_008603 [Oedothorax gibbosus]